MTNPLIRHLEQFGSLPENEKQVLESLVARSASFRSDQDLVSDGDVVTECRLLLTGFACRYKLLPDGRRQIMSFQIPGDICDLQGLLLNKLDHSISALVPSTVALIPHRVLHEVTDAYPSIARALWRSTLVDAAVFREWIVNVGNRQASARLAHLVCEVGMRLKAVGLVHDNSFEFPVTQIQLGEALGISTVHVNRVLQELRRQELFEFRSGKVTIYDWDGLTRAGEFDPSYLHVESRNDTDANVTPFDRSQNRMRLGWQAESQEVR
jgi:CRP-like cAMP-binding protein